MISLNTNFTSIKGIHYKTEQPIEVFIKDSHIKDICILNNVESQTLPFIAPGLVDLQINGFKGMDFNASPLSYQVVLDMTYALLKEGITSYCPTIITNKDETIKSHIKSIVEACNRDNVVEKTIVGIHLEGPFISPKDGPRGAHNPKFIQGTDWSLFESWQEAAQGKIKIITLSPEWKGSTYFIEKCVKSGVKVSIGHTSASIEQIQEAVSAGATLSTHLGNGAHAKLDRHPNYIWEQLSEDQLWATIIADGFHLPKSVLKVMIRTKGKKLILISDAVSLTGIPAGEYESFIGGKVILSPSGRLSVAANPKYLAGSAQLLTGDISYLVTNEITDLATAWEMSSVRPSSFLNLPTAEGLSIGAPADLVLFNWAGQNICVCKTLKSGSFQ